MAPWSSGESGQVTTTSVPTLVVVSYVIGSGRLAAWMLVTAENVPVPWMLLALYLN